MIHQPTRPLALFAAAMALAASLQAYTDGPQADAAAPANAALATRDTSQSQYPAPQGEVQELPAQF